MESSQAQREMERVYRQKSKQRHELIGKHAAYVGKTLRCCRRFCTRSLAVISVKFSCIMRNLGETEWIVEAEDDCRHNTCVGRWNPRCRVEFVCIHVYR